MEDAIPVIRVRNLSFTYPNGSCALSKVNLIVHPGCITAILGPSASGKTTLFSSIVGLLQPSAVGEIHRSYKSLGFMPQNYCLHEYFTVKEILYFYAKLYGVSQPEAIMAKLLHTFELPQHQTVQNLSGGMKRRVSLCCAILHHPELIILDEPTVGVDPMLRRKMWDYFLELSSKGSAILVSTHYTEEAALAHQYVFLRKGRVLESGKVTDLKNLKDKYYQQCLEDHLTFSSQAPVHSSKLNYLKKSLTPSKLKFLTDNPIESSESLRAMIHKNLIVLKRHKFFMLFQAILPLATLLIFSWCIGKSPRDISLTIVNEDQENCSNFQKTDCPSLMSIINQNFDFMTNTSCKILEDIPSSIFKINYHEKSVEDAKRRIINGESLAIVHFPKDFSKNLALKFKNQMDSSDEENSFRQDKGSIGIFLDASNKLISDQIHIGIYSALKKTLENFIRECSIPLETSTIIMDIDFIIDLEDKRSLTTGMLPVMMNAVLYFMGFALTADLTASEKEAGLLVRLTLAGVPFKSMIGSQLLVQSSVVLSQILLCLSFLKVMVCPEASVFILCLVGFLFSLQSLSGMTIGVLLSTLCSSRDQVIQYGLAIIFPTFLLCGVLWPLASLPLPLKVISYSLPGTITGQFIQRLLFRQVIDSYTQLMLSILVPLAWSAGSGLLTLYYAFRTGSLYKL